MAVAALLLADPLSAWSSDGHRSISTTAFKLVAPLLPGLRPAELEAMVQASLLPDLMRPRNLSQLRDREAPEHYLDLERLSGHRLPATRSEYLKLVARLAVMPQGGLGESWTMESVGAVPYAVVEGTQRLAVALALVRRRPQDATLRDFAWLQAGTVAHYAQDLCQPLHTTVHFDGRLQADGTSPRSGLHGLVDSLLAKPGILQPKLGSRSFVAYPDLLAAVEELLGESHDLVDRVYELEPELRALQDSSPPSAALQAFAEERFREAVGFTADLLATAWLLSEDVDLPTWWPLGSAPDEPGG